MVQPGGDSESERDNTAQARAIGNETVLEGQKKALELTVHGAPLGDVLDVIARTVEAQSTNGVLSSILLLDADAKRLRHGAAPSLPAEYNAAIDGVAIGPTIGSCGTAAFTGETVVVSDIASDPLWANFKELALKHGLRACWSTPILSSQGRVLGTFALYHRTKATPTARDREVVELLGRTAALLIERDHQARERAAIEATLRAEREHQAAQVRTMLHRAPAAIGIVRGPTYVFELANPKYIELIGGISVLGKSAIELFPELVAEGGLEPLNESYRTGKPYFGSMRVMVRRGAGEPEEAFYDYIYQPIPDVGGAVDSVLVMAFEVTDRVRAKEDAEAARAQAQASEHGLKTFIDNLPELAWTARPDGHIDYYNKRWYEYTGTTFEEMQGWGWEKVHDPELLPKVVERWRRSLETGEPFEMEFTLRGKDGVPRWFLTRIVPLRGAAGEILRWFGINTDINDIKSIQALTAAMAEQSREAQRMLLEMRADKERAERRVAELEAEKRSL